MDILNQVDALFVIENLFKQKLYTFYTKRKCSKKAAH